jgi:hypothetical protein
MTSLNYSALREKAAKEGKGGDAEDLPPGEGYQGEIVAAGAKPKPSGYSLWWRVKVLVGPKAGTVTFLSQILNPENGPQLDIFFRVLKNLSIDFDQVPDGTPPESIAKLALGRKISFDIVHNPSKKDSTKVFANFININLIDEVAEAPAAADPATAGPTVEELQAKIAALSAPAADPIADLSTPAADELPF